ncbi:MAG: AEC family transporter [Pseudomonadota bacterium]
MTIIFLALAPIFLLIVLGHILRRIDFVPISFWPAAEKTIYYVFFPCLLVSELATAEIEILDLLGMGLSMMAAVVVMAVLILLLGRFWRMPGPAFSSVFQGGIRPNSYIGLAAAFGMFGPQGVALAGIGIAFVVPTVNVLAVAALVRYGNKGSVNRMDVVRGIVTNPLIIAVFIGVACNLSGLPIVPVLGDMMEILGRASLPLGLLAVGAGLDFEAARKGFLSVGTTSAIKLLAVPALTAVACLVLGVTGMAATVAVLYNALPTSASSYVLARQMGGDAAMMAGIITVTTLVAIVTIPAVMFLAP